MKQVVQPISGGSVTVLDVPRPRISATEVLVRTVTSVISPGTERAVSRLAQSSLLAKARARPDLVRQVVNKARTEGISSTAKAVRSRLASDVPLGYSAVGVVVEVGDAVEGIRPGDLVATGGAGKANHAEWQAVPGLLCSVVPSGVEPDDAAFATVASIALHGLRLADVAAGSNVVVVGLGLIGQLAVRLAIASGCNVAGIDLHDTRLDLAAEAGALAARERGELTTAEILAWSRNRGADVVLVCAATKSSDLMARVPALCADRARVVIVGDVGLDLDRGPFYERELTLLFARSYGPGRYDRSYEDWGVDYPAGQVRWTEGRNMEAVLDLLAAKRLHVSDLVTHRFAIDAAAEAYDLLERNGETALAITIAYPVEPRPDAPVVLRADPTPSGPGVGWVGAGAFSTSVLIPAFQDAGFGNLVAVASASGLSARRLGERAGFARAVSGADAVINDPDVGVVVVATAHDTHAVLVAGALEAGKHVWCEKPLALSLDELDLVRAAYAPSGRVLFVGYNRRFSPAVAQVRTAFAGRSAPLTIVYRVAAGPVPVGHWYADRRQGGRLLGEACHFVDTCAALVGAEPATVHATGGDLLTGDAAISMHFADGSLAVVVYTAAAPRGVGKEWVEIVSGDKRAVIDDFRSLTIDGEKTAPRHQDKGHRAAVRAFAAALRDPSTATATIASMFATSEATLRAAATLGSDVAL